MKKPALPPGIDEVMQKLKTCRNFQPNPYFERKPRRKQPPKRKEVNKL